MLRKVYYHCKYIEIYVIYSLDLEQLLTCTDAFAAVCLDLDGEEFESVKHSDVVCLRL